jgi:choline dehydrogenase-like flavoprotein
MADPTYDYVIVGAGSAGCALAWRLGADPDCRILVVEAGGWDRDPLIHVPLGWGQILKKRLHDWMYFCEPEETLDGRAIEFARGKVVGGCSSTNAMAYVRGDPADFDRWASYGLPGWSFDDCLPFFKRQEDWEGGESAWRGAGGPLTVQTCRYSDPLVDSYGQAAVDAGMPWTDDYNGSQHEGFGRLQMTIRNGRRCSAATAYLRPAIKRGNVEIVVGALVTRIVFESDRAVGVAFRKGGGEEVVARAEREVILSAGVANTPQLLMLSGIGEPDQLAEHGIAPRVALPGVGADLQDHPSVMLMYRRAEPSPFLKAMRADRIGPSMAAAYLFGKGFAADVPGGITGFFKSAPEQPVPDLQVLLTAASLASWPWFPGVRPPFTDAWVARLVLTRPESRGSIRLSSADPAAAPRVRQNMLSREADWRALRIGVARLEEIAGQPSMARFTAGRIAPADGPLGTEAIDAHIRATAITVHHPLGTCRMGPDSDAGAVVGPDLMVKGCEGLRIVDASVMPDAVCGNINAAVIMIAEKAADMIRGDAAEVARAA